MINDVSKENADKVAKEIQSGELRPPLTSLSLTTSTPSSAEHPSTHASTRLVVSSSMYVCSLLTSLLLSLPRS